MMNLVIPALYITCPCDCVPNCHCSL